MDKYKGWAFPVKADAASGKIIEVSENELIKQSIMMILTTRKGERFLLPDFGCGLSDFIFREINYTILKQIEEEVYSSIQKWEKRITDLSVVTEMDRYNPGAVRINIFYKVAVNGASMNLTHLLDISGMME